MLALKATAAATSALRSLKTSNPELFATVSARMGDLRADPGGRAQGRTFRLDDGRSARLATYYDTVAQRELVIVWLIEDAPAGGVLHVVAVAYVP